ncbi:MAG: hypothetical protein HZC41_24725 [Chloroflexi bacterium]|nr:hypothetical protein [Chloroflexota bacterium]
MSQNQLPPDPDSLSRWEQMPHNQPSKQALPPMAGGARWSLWLLGLLFVLMVIALLQGRMG